MSTSGSKETCILEDPNALRHMDALFDVLGKQPGSGAGGRRNSKTEGGGRSAASSAAELVCGGPPADVEFLLDALFAVVETETGRGGRGETGRAAAIAPMVRGATSAKSWKERKLPASFFDAGGSGGPPAVKEEASDAAGASGTEDDTEDSPVPSPDSESSRQVPNSSTGLAPLPVVLVNTNTTDSLTFYIDKHLQCRVNMEPALERRRRLARGRVQKYRSMKKRRKPRKLDNESGGSKTQNASCS